MSNMHWWSVEQKFEKMVKSYKVSRICDACDYEAKDQHNLDARHFKLNISSAELVRNSVYVIFVTTVLKTREI